MLDIHNEYLYAMYTNKLQEEVHLMETSVPTTPTRYYRLLHQQREAQLLLAVLRLDLFTHFDHWTSAAELTASAGFPEDQLGLVLEALAAAGFIQEESGRYRNTAEAAEYLSRNSRHCIRDALLFRSQMTTLEKMDQLVARGGEPAASEMPYDFAGLAEAVVPEMYATGRVESFLREMEKQCNIAKGKAATPLRYWLGCREDWQGYRPDRMQGSWSRLAVPRD
jgi:hypothetical protein